MISTKLQVSAVYLLVLALTRLEVCEAFALSYIEVALRRLSVFEAYAT